MIRKSAWEQHTVYEIACDDATGGVLVILHAADGDLHISMRHDPAQTNADEALAGHPVVRLRSGIGGGDHPNLQLALCKALMAERGPRVVLDAAGPQDGAG